MTPLRETLRDLSRARRCVSAPTTPLRLTRPVLTRTSTALCVVEHDCGSDADHQALKAKVDEALGREALEIWEQVGQRPVA